MYSKYNNNSINDYVDDKMYRSQRLQPRNNLTDPNIQLIKL